MRNLFTTYSIPILKIPNLLYDTFPFQLIIFGSWIFSSIFSIPDFLALNVQGKICVPLWPEKWMSKAYYWVWFVLVVLSVALMAGLYTRIVHNLWFKRNDGNQLTRQQRVSDQDVFYARYTINQ